MGAVDGLVEVGVGVGLGLDGTLRTLVGGPLHPIHLAAYSLTESYMPKGAALVGEISRDLEPRQKLHHYHQQW